MQRVEFWTTLSAILAVFGSPGANGQDFVFPGASDTQFLPDYRNGYVNQQEASPFRQGPPGFQPLDSYLPQRDLQTSDLPFHLQQTLPQYRITEKTPQFQAPPQFNYRNVPAPFRQQENIAPSTHRPDYSHLFSHSHNRNPSQPETFLGEITLQSPAELPPLQFGESQTQKGAESNVNQNLDYTERPKIDNAVRLGTRANFLNHRTRIFAPANDNTDNKKVLVKNYFVNNNGEVFITTKVPFSPKPTTTWRPPTTVEKKNNFVPSVKPTGKPLSFNLKSNKKPFVPKNAVSTTPRDSFDLEPLLEEPIKSSKSTNSNDDVVEVIKSEEVTNSTMEKPSKIEETTEDYDYEAVSTDNVLNSSEYEDEDTIGDENDKDNNIRDEEYSEEELDDDYDEEPEEEEPKKATNSSSFDVITTKPLPVTEEDNFESFVDTTVIDTGSEEPQTTPVFEENATFMTTDLPIVVSMSSSVNVRQGDKTLTKPEISDDKEKEPELVVSVVTTKSVVNNTIVATATPMPPVTENMLKTSTDEPANSSENSTDTWVVVASVQTSRSVSGARYLPSSIVAQDERHKLLNEEEEEENETTTESDLVTTTLLSPSSTKSSTKTSTESLIDKLDRVQSDLSIGLLTDGFKSDDHIAVIKEPMGDKVDATTIMLDLGSTTTKSPLPQVVIKKFSPHSRPSSTHRPKTTRRTTTTTTESPPSEMNKMQGDEPPKDAAFGRSSGISNETKITVQDVSAFLPPGFKPDKSKDDSSKLLAEILGKIKKEEPKPVQVNETLSKIVDNAKKDDISALLPPGYKGDEAVPKNQTELLKSAKVDDVSAFLPPGYKGFKPKHTTTTTTTSTEKPENPIESILAKAKPIEDLSGLLPPDFKATSTTKKPKSGVESLLEQARPMDISAFLPPGFNPNKYSNKRTTTQKPTTVNIEKDEVPTSLLPPGFRRFGSSKGKDFSASPTTSSTTSTTETMTTSTSTTPKPAGGFKVVFPSRPGGGARKSATRLTTPRSDYEVEDFKVTSGPTIRKGLPSRATTEFTGWPTPSTTPISIEKLLEAARAAASSTSSPSDEISSTTTTTTTTTSTTTTPKPTTPGICLGECDLAGTIKLVGGAKWAPELLDRNTKEWQILANEVQSQLERVYSRSNVLNKWYKEIRIDGFSEGSVLVDYLVELNDLGRQIDTGEIKKLFHESLDDALADSAAGNREGKSLNETEKLEGKLSLGDFVVDPTYTDFIVLPKQAYPTVGYAEDNVLLPQWAIAVIVIGLASLLFVIIFGVTVLVNRQKNAKKKAPVPLTEDMLNELNKNHMGGLDNYGADDLYNMEDVWNDRGYDPKLAKKRSSGSIHDNSTSNLYDSWRSEWNGYYYNAYYGNNNPGSSHGGYGRRKSDYDTNF